MSQDILPHASAQPTNLAWLNAMKAIALLWIGLNHVVEQLLGSPYFGNPGPAWGTLSDRITQVLPLTNYGWANLPINFLRYLGWMGDQGVQLFLIASGLGCTWSLYQRCGGDRLPILDFYRRRLGRIYPIWWVAHILCLPLAIWVGSSPGLPVPTLTSPLFYASFLGLRFVPGAFYYFSVPWWFI
jgi:peptidoglycan/LPS O-acetylase OafA/YrhL